MFDDKKLWKDRAGQRLKDLGRYLRYIFNGHLVIVLVFLLGSAAFYYQKWVATLSQDFPAEIIIGLIMGFALTYSPLYNFLFEADKVFLLPLEEKLKQYFFRSGIVSFIFQAYILLIILAAVMPMYAQVSPNGFGSFLPFLGFLFLAKIWNMAASWKIHYYVAASIHNTDIIVRFFINVTFVFLLFKQANWLILLSILIIMVFYYLMFQTKTKNLGLKWDLLIEAEEKRMDSFYRLANLFTDVPHIKTKVKRRVYFDFILSGIRFKNENTFLYLYSRTFLRSSDYLGLFVRLTVIGAVAIYYISFGWGQVLISVLFIYLTGFQLLPLWKHHQHKLWVDLYPVSDKKKTSAFQNLLTVILALQSLLLSLAILAKGEWTLGLVNLIADLLFSLFFVRFYSKSRLKQS